MYHQCYLTTALCTTSVTSLLLYVPPVLPHYCSMYHHQCYLTTALCTTSVTSLLLYVPPVLPHYCSMYHQCYLTTALCTTSVTSLLLYVPPVLPHYCSMYHQCYLTTALCTTSRVCSPPQSAISSKISLQCRWRSPCTLSVCNMSPSFSHSLTLSNTSLKSNVTQNHLLLVSRPDLWGSPFWVRFLCMWSFSNQTIEMITFCLCTWCMLGVFLLPAFTHPGH